jgi:hypothetical protein
LLLTEVLKLEQQRGKEEAVKAVKDTTKMDSAQDASNCIHGEID